MALKKYSENLKEIQVETGQGPSGVACSEKNCDGEMMIQAPTVEHYKIGKKGEEGAVKSGLVRAVCNKCGWKGWV